MEKLRSKKKIHDKPFTSPLEDLVYLFESLGIQSQFPHGKRIEALEIAQIKKFVSLALKLFENHLKNNLIDIKFYYTLNGANKFELHFSLSSDKQDIIDSFKQVKVRRDANEYCLIIAEALKSPIKKVKVCKKRDH